MKLQFTILYFFQISVDKTEALHKQSSLQVASAGTSSVSSSIGVSSASSSSLISPPTKFYSYLMSLLFSYAARLATTSGRQYVHHTSSIVSLIMFVLISFSCVSFTSQLSFLSYSRAQENDMTSQAISNIQKNLSWILKLRSNNCLSKKCWIIYCRIIRRCLKQNKIGCFRVKA